MSPANGAPGIAQLHIHDAKRDAAAQEAKKTAAKIQSGDIFRKQSANLQTLIDRDVATTVADAKIEMEAMINGLRQWGDVAELSGRVKSIEAPVSADEIEKRKQALADAKTNLKNQINALSKSAGSEADELKPFVDKLGNVDSALGFANEHLGTDSEGSKTAMMVLEKLQGLYKQYQDQFDAVNKVNSRLAELGITGTAQRRGAVPPNPSRLV